MKPKKLKEADKLEKAGVLAFTREGKFVREYSSTAEAVKILQLNPVSLDRCLKGIQKTTGGYQWRYRVDPNFDEGIFAIPPLKVTDLNFHPVVQYNLEGKFVKEYNSIKEAAEISGILSKAIVNCINKKSNIVGQYRWRLKKDVCIDGEIRDIKPVRQGKTLRAVCQFAKDGTFIRQYPSILEAAGKTNINKYTIYRCAIKKSNTCGGFQWRFKDDPIFKNGIKDIPPFKKKVQKKKAREPFIFQFDLNGSFIRPYSTVKAAAKSVGIPGESIRNALAKCTLTAGGYQWRYNSDPEISNGVMNIAPVFKK